MTEIDWSLTTWEGSRREQHKRFYALPLREKVLQLEQMAEVAGVFSAVRRIQEEARRNVIP